MLMTLNALHCSLTFHPVYEDFQTALISLIQRFLYDRTPHITAFPIVPVLKYLSDINNLGLKFSRFIGAMDGQVVVSKTHSCE